MHLSQPGHALELVLAHHPCDALGLGLHLWARISRFMDSGFGFKVSGLGLEVSFQGS